MSRTRLLYSLACCAMALAAYAFLEPITGSGRYMGYFSYFGTVATAIGLVVAVCEVVHSVRMTASVHRQAKEMLDHAQAVETASSFSHCLASIDEATAFVASDDYTSAIKSFQFLRKVYVKLLPRSDASDLGLNALGRIERSLYNADRADDEEPLSKRQKIILLDRLLHLKQDIESSNPARMTIDASP